MSWKAVTDFVHGFSEGALMAALPLLVVGLVVLGSVKQCGRDATHSVEVEVP